MTEDNVTTWYDYFTRVHIPKSSYNWATGPRGSVKPSDKPVAKTPGKSQVIRSSYRVQEKCTALLPDVCQDAELRCQVTTHQCLTRFNYSIMVVVLSCRLVNRVTWCRTCGQSCGSQWILFLIICITECVSVIQSTHWNSIKRTGRVISAFHNSLLSY